MLGNLDLHIEKYGYATKKMSPDDLEIVRNLIKANYLKRLETLGQGIYTKFQNLPMDSYHEESQKIDHSQTWPQSDRFLSKDDVTEIKKLNFFKNLQSEFGNFVVLDIDNNGWESFVWRIVRPQTLTDPAPIHADYWFNEIGAIVDAPPGTHRVKAWIAIYCDYGNGGIGFLPMSHIKTWPFHAEEINGVKKPRHDISPVPEVEPFLSNPGDMFIFHDRLLHCGLPSDKKTRFSLEFTMYVKN